MKLSCIRPESASGHVLVLLLLAGLAACSTPSSLVSPEGTDSVEIFRDSFGTPHIFASTNYGVYYGYGYAVATDRLYQIEMLKRTTSGRVAEVLGAEFVGLDTHIRTSYDLATVQRQILALPRAEREILQAYADGVNHRIRQVMDNPAGLLPLEFIENDFTPQLWQAQDVALNFIGAVAHRYSDFNSELDNLELLQTLIRRKGKVQGWNAFNASKWLLDKDSIATAPGSKAPGANPPSYNPPSMPSYLGALRSVSATTRIALNPSGRYEGITSDYKIRQMFDRAVAKHGFESSPEFAGASNFWAVNNKPASANGILVNGPQFGFSTPSYVYGVGLHGGDFNVVGNTLLGLPALLFAHNNFMAWGSTAGLSDQVDVYIEELNPNNPEQYLYRGEYLDFESWTETIKVKNSSPVTVTARRSVHGMVTSYQPDKNLAYSRARAWEGRELATLTAWINLARDRNVKRFRARLGGIATNINLYYMDRQGNLGYVHTGRYPLRVKGHDSRLPVPGTGQFDWPGFRPYRENPYAFNPDSGYLANWNNRPRSDWISSDLWNVTWGRADRVHILLEQLERHKEGVTVEDMWSINRMISLKDVSAPFVLPYLRQALQRTGGLTPVQKEAADILLAWDQVWKTNSKHRYGPEAALMEVWLAELLERVFKDDIGEKLYGLYSPTNTPVHALGGSMNLGPGTKILTRNLDYLSRGEAPEYDFFNGQDYHQVLAESFKAAVATLAAEQGSAVSAWQKPAYPLQWKPYNFRGVPQADDSLAVSHPFYMNRGSENNIFVAGDDGFTAYDVIPPGQSGFISPQKEKAAHTSDQMSLFTDYKYKQVFFSKQQIEAHAVDKVVLKITIN